MKRKTDDEFKKEVFELVGDEYEVLGEYKNAKNKIEIFHKECGKNYFVSPDSFLKGRRCPNCNGKFKKTTEQFKKELYELVGDEYLLLDEYKNNRTKVKMIHQKCGMIYYVVPTSFLSGCRCPKCSKEQKTTDVFKREVYELVGDEYKVLGVYKNSRTKIEIEHQKCGHVHTFTPDSFLRKPRCVKCSKRMIRTTDQFKKEIFELVGNEYEVLSDYEKASKKIRFKHNVCGKEFEVTSTMFLRGTRCSHCFKNERKTTKKFKEDIKKVVGDEYAVAGEYKNTRTKVDLLHKNCGRIFSVKPRNFLYGTRCPYCRESKGEIKIRQFLESKNIPFEREFTFEDCVHKGKLRFDFCIKLDGGKVPFILIEFNGKQHYEKCVHFGGARDFEASQRRDAIKEDYCKSNDIPLVVIPYTDFEKIDEILENTLEFHGTKGEILID